MPDSEKEAKSGPDMPEVYTILGVALAALVIRLVAAAVSDFYVDECYVYYLAGHDFNTIVRISIADTNPPLWHLFMGLMVRITDNKLLLRLPSVLLSVGSVVFVYMAGKLAAGKKTALFTALIYAVAYNSWLIHSQNRMYGAACLLAALAYYILFGFIVKPERFNTKGWFIVFVAANLLMPHMHYTFILAVGAAFVCGVFLLNKKLKPKVLIALALIMVSFMGWIHYVKSAGRNPSFKFAGKPKEKTAWSPVIEGYKLSTFITGAELPLYWSFVRESVFQVGAAKNVKKAMARHKTVNVFLFLLRLALWAAFAAGIAGLYKENKNVALAILLLFILPFAAFIVVTALGFKLIYQLRYNVFIFPLFLIPFCHFLTSLKGRRLKYIGNAFLAILVFIGLFTGLYEFRHDSFFWVQDWTTVSNFVKGSQRKGDVISAYIPYSLQGFARVYSPDYLQWKFITHPNKRYDLFLAIKKGYFQQGGLPIIPIELDRIPQPLERSLGPSRVFLVLNQETYEDPHGRVAGFFARRYDLVKGYKLESYNSLGRISVFLLKPKNNTGGKPPALKQK